MAGKPDTPCPKCPPKKDGSLRLHVAGKLKLGGIDLGMCQSCARKHGIIASRGHRYRLYPTPEQAEEMQRRNRAARWIYNIRVREMEWLLADYDAECRRAWRETRERLYPDVEGKLSDEQYKHVRAERPKVTIKETCPKGWKTPEPGCMVLGWTDDYALVKLFRADPAAWGWRDDTTAPANTLRDAVSDFKTALGNWASGRARRPVWANKPGGSHRVYSQESQMAGDQLAKQGIRLPGMRDRVKWVCHRRWRGAPRNMTISEEPDGKWYAAVTTEWIRKPPVHRTPSVVGVDPGMVRSMTASDGTVIESINRDPHIRRALDLHERRASKRAKRVARAAARGAARNRNGEVQPVCTTSRGLKHAGLYLTNNQRKHYKQQARLHSRAALRREDIQRKAAQDLASRHEVIVFEDSSSKNLSARKVGAGAAGRGFNRALLAEGWYGFKLKCMQKAAAYGGQVIEVPAAYTSRTCPQCGDASAENRPDQATFRCTKCGYTANADDVAAHNVRMLGLAAIQDERERVSATVTAEVAREVIPEWYRGVTRLAGPGAKVKPSKRKARSQLKQKAKGKQALAPQAGATESN